MGLGSFHQSLMGLQDEFKIFSSESDGISFDSSFYDPESSGFQCLWDFSFLYYR